MRISYGPDSVVDSNPHASNAEPAIAADRSAAATLVAAAESGTFSSPPQAFVSHDGGYDWSVAPLLLGNNGSMLGDVQLATDPDGTIYFAALGHQGSKEGIQFFASANHGDWFRHVSFTANGRGHGFDHEQLTIDTSRDPYRGRIYMSALYALQLQPQLNACGLLWSSDGGRLFHGPVQVIDGWCFNSRPVVLSDGTVIFPFIMGSKVGASGLPPETRTQKVEVAISKNGGRTFAMPHVIGTYVWPGMANYKRRMAAGETDFDGDPIPQFTAGISPVTHRDVMYGVWSDMRTENSRLLFTKSTDEGRHWSTPRAILTTANPRDAQYQVSLAVNDRGVLGVAYLQYLNASRDITEMFADSTDSGATFSKPVPIQSTPAALSLPGAAGYTAFAYREEKSKLKEHLLVEFTDPTQRFPSGGDYVQMVADRNGTFHPIWADARTGTSQVWTASVTVGAGTNVPANLSAADVSGDVDVQFGARTWDKARHLLSVPVRLHNVGTRPLYPPFTVTVLRVDTPLLPPSWNPRVKPSLVNADNGRRGVGAVYTYGPRMLGNLGVLAPGAETAARTWKIVVSGQNPAIVLRIDGYESP
ncbi:MAG: hypothetical protein ACREMP_04825 [Candidatus Tyrphobacter sp.]